MQELNTLVYTHVYKHIVYPISATVKFSSLTGLSFNQNVQNRMLIMKTKWKKEKILSAESSC